MFYPWTLMATLGLIIPPGPGNWVSPIKKLSIFLAACLPSVIAQTTSDWPLKKKQQQILTFLFEIYFLKSKGWVKKNATHNFADFGVLECLLHKFLINEEN